MEDLWAECERGGWLFPSDVERLVALLEAAGDHERAAEARKRFAQRNGPPCKNLGGYPIPPECWPDMTPEYVQQRIDILQRIANR